LPTPVARARYWHRNLHPKKLTEIGFAHLGPRMTLQRAIKLYQVPEKPQLPGFRQLRVEDIPQCHALLTRYLSTRNIHPEISVEEFTYWFTPRDDVVYAYVIEQPDSTITDLGSFYNLPSSVIGHAKYSNLKAAYSFYQVVTTVSLESLVNDLLTSAKSNEFDVFNMLDLMDNSSVMTACKFGIGNGSLQYYLYNWDCPTMDPSQVGLVLM